MDKNRREAVVFWTTCLSVLLIVFFIGFGVGHCGENQLSGNWGYGARTNSGNTFKYNTMGKDDKDLNSQCWMLEYTRWAEEYPLGVYVYGGKDINVSEEMKPGWNYNAQVKYAGLGGKWKFVDGDTIDLYVGGGVNYTRLRNGYNHKVEVFREFGWDVVTGMDVDVYKQLFITFNARYTWNKMKSEVHRKTYFHQGAGVRGYVGMGIKW